jgi:lipoprotein-anchoring transpeptidase ErfK/SrfK
MSNTGRRIARACVLALLVGFAPVASAVGQEAEPDAGEEAERPTILTRAAAAKSASEMAAPAAANVLVEKAVQTHIDAKENRRIAVEVEAEAAKLSPGSFVWRPENAQSGPVEMVVNLKAQRAHIFRAGKLIGVTTVSTGRKGNVTPVGTFPILQKKRMHNSNLYNNAPMPNMQRMTWDGVALHAGKIPGYAASHGCVRLPAVLSDLLFGVTRIGNVVHVVADSRPRLSRCWSTPLTRGTEDRQSAAPPCAGGAPPACGRRGGADQLRRA